MPPPPLLDFALTLLVVSLRGRHNSGSRRRDGDSCWGNHRSDAGTGCGLAARGGAWLAALRWSAWGGADVGSGRFGQAGAVEETITSCCHRRKGTRVLYLRLLRTPSGVWLCVLSLSWVPSPVLGGTLQRYLSLVCRTGLVPHLWTDTGLESLQTPNVTLQSDKMSDARTFAPLWSCGSSLGSECACVSLSSRSSRSSRRSRPSYWDLRAFILTSSSSLLCFNSSTS